MLTLKTRRIITYLFIIGFFIAAPLLILYTAGYRYNFKKQKISRAGSLVIETVPRDASIRLNNSNEILNSPLRLTDIFPNDYVIEVFRDGYYHWQKTLPIYSQQTTFAEDIILFKKSEPRTINDQDIIAPITSPDLKSFIYQHPENNTTYIVDFNIENQETTKLYNLDDNELINISWSPSNDKLLLTTTEKSKTKFTVVEKKNPATPLSVNLFPQANSVRTKWAPTNNHEIDILADQKLYRVNLNNDQLVPEEIHAFNPNQKITDFLIHNNNLYYLEKTPNRVTLKKFQMNVDPQPLFNEIELDAIDYELVEVLNDKIVLKENKNQHSYLINLNLDTVLLEKNNLLGYSHQTQNNQFLLFDDTEIITTNFKSYPFTIETITRVSSGITQANWYDDVPYIYFLQDGRINIIEMDKRDVRNLITLEPQNVTFALVDRQGEHLYYTTSESPGLFQLTLMD